MGCCCVPQGNGRGPSPSGHSPPYGGDVLPLGRNPRGQLPGVLPPPPPPPSGGPFPSSGRRYPPSAPGGCGSPTTPPSRPSPRWLYRSPLWDQIPITKVLLNTFLPKRIWDFSALFLRPKYLQNGSFVLRLELRSRVIVSQNEGTHSPGLGVLGYHTSLRI